jgi:hypothetical protein
LKLKIHRLKDFAELIDRSEVFKQVKISLEYEK